MAVNIATLKTEITTDPRGYGLVARMAAGDVAGVAERLNLVRDGTVGTRPTNPTGAGGQASGLISVERPDITTAEILDAILVTEFAASMSNMQAAWFESLLQQDQGKPIRFLLNGVDTRILTNLLALFTNAATTKTRLRALGTRAGSRAEELFGYGEVVTVDHVSQARDS